MSSNADIPETVNTMSCSPYMLIFRLAPSMWDDVLARTVTAHSHLLIATKLSVTAKPNRQLVFLEISFHVFRSIFSSGVLQYRPIQCLCNNAVMTPQYCV